RRRLHRPPPAPYARPAPTHRARHPRHLTRRQRGHGRVVRGPCLGGWCLTARRAPRVREYRRRQQVEAVSQDGTTRGWNLEASTRTERNRLNRLPLALFLALWWSHLRGQQVVRRGERRRFDRTDRRDCS